MIDHGGITLNEAINCQVAPVSSICDFSVLQNADCHLSGISSFASIFEDGHCSFGGIIDGAEVIFLVLVAVKAGSCMNEDGRKVPTIAFVAPAHNSGLGIRPCSASGLGR
jgi:hypothetical protein